MSAIHQGRTFAVESDGKGARLVFTSGGRMPLSKDEAAEMLSLLAAPRDLGPVRRVRELIVRVDEVFPSKFQSTFQASALRDLRDAMPALDSWLAAAPASAAPESWDDAPREDLAAVVAQRDMLAQKLARERTRRRLLATKLELLRRDNLEVRDAHVYAQIWGLPENDCQGRRSTIGSRLAGVCVELKRAREEVAALKAEPVSVADELPSQLQSALAEFEFDWRRNEWSDDQRDFAIERVLSAFNASDDKHRRAQAAKNTLGDSQAGKATGFGPVTAGSSPARPTHTAAVAATSCDECGRAPCECDVPTPHGLIAREAR